MLLALLLTRVSCVIVCVVKQKTAYEMRISDWSSDVCSSDLIAREDEDALRAPGAVAAPGGGSLQRDLGAQRLPAGWQHAARPLPLPGPHLKVAGDQRKPDARYHVPHGVSREGDRPRLSLACEHGAERERALRARLDRNAARAPAAGRARRV